MPHNLLRSVIVELICRMPPRLRFFLGSVILIPVGVYAINIEIERREDRERVLKAAIDEERRAQEARVFKNREKVDSISMEYNESVRHLASRSMNSL